MLLKQPIMILIITIPIYPQGTPIYIIVVIMILIMGLVPMLEVITTVDGTVVDGVADNKFGINNERNHAAQAR